MIPRRLVRTVPEVSTPEQEHLWDLACRLHPDWVHVTLRDPQDRAQFPLTSAYFDTCESGAQLADLIRAEDLYRHGGIYLDSDVMVHKPLNPFLGLEGFAAYEDSDHIPNAVMGFTPRHPALRRVIELAIERQGQGTWAAGVGVTTEVFEGRGDMLILPPGTFYPVHYLQKHKADWDTVEDRFPWAYTSHMWRHSWA